MWRLRGTMLMHELCFHTSDCACMNSTAKADTERHHDWHHDTTIPYNQRSQLLQSDHAAAAISVSICMLLLLYLFPSAYCCWHVFGKMHSDHAVVHFAICLSIGSPLLTGCCIQPWQDKSLRHGAGSKLERAPRVTQRVPAR